jgi:hypothetical protein
MRVIRRARRWPRRSVFAFIKEAANPYIDSVDRTLQKPALFIGMYSAVGRIRLIGTDKVLPAAKKTAASIVDPVVVPGENLRTHTS